MRLEKPEPQFDRGKLVEAVHYICSRADAKSFGNVHLHKALYFSDMLSFLASGAPITGVQYLKQKFGPTARHLTWALKTLEDKSVISIENEDFYGYTKKKYVVKKEYRAEKLSIDERKLLDEITKFVGERSAREISEFSHNAAWDSVNLGEEIPYHSVYRWVPVEITDEDVNWANDVIKRNAFERP